MAALIKLKKSSTAAAVPTAGAMDYGELAINYKDGILYYKDDVNVIKQLASNATVAGAVLLTGTQTITGAKTFNSTLTLASGTATVPAIAFSSSTGLGFYRSSDNVLGFAANGFERWLTDSSAIYGATGAAQITGSFYIKRDAGTVALPTYAFGGDTNTGMWRSAADTLELVTNGTARVTIDSTGNVGIGTTTPTGKLDIQGSSVHDLPTYSAEFLLGTTWVSTGWTGGPWPAGWAHTTGNTSVLSHDKVAVITTKYQITYTVTSRTAGSFTIAFGGESIAGVSADGAWGPTTSSTAPLAITPTTDFNGTIAISIKSITGISTSLVNLKSSDGTARIEIRANNALGNTFIGLGAGRYNTTGNYNASNGSYSLLNNTTGYQNTANGYGSLYYNTTGNWNTAVGMYSLLYNTTGYTNTAVGAEALLNNTTGYSNTAVGRVSLYSNLTGYYNVAVGMDSLEFNTTGYYNTAIGAISLYSNLTGYNNTSVGYSAGRTLTTGNSNTFLGYNAGFHGSQSTSSVNSMALGNGAYTTADNQIVIGNTSVTQTQLNGNVGIGTTTPGDVLHISANGGVGFRIQDATSSTGGDTRITQVLQKLSINTYSNGHVFTGTPFVIDGATQNVGIGTTTPTGKLDIQGSAAHDLPTYSAEFLLGTTWVSTGWTGSFATGWAHATGNTSTLSHDKVAVITTKYQITYTVTNYTVGAFNIGFGGEIFAGVNATGAWGPTTSSTAPLTITPTTDFTGTIAISIKSITSVSTALVILKSSDGTARIEIRANNPTANNTFIGLGAGRYTTTGYQNTANGYSSLYYNTTGFGNHAVGLNALQNNTTGYYNIAIGNAALQANTTGINNLACGQASLNVNATAGSNNTAYGYASLLSATNSSSNNTVVGANAGRTLTTSNNNTFLGYNAGYHASQSLTASNSMALGNGTYTTADNQVVIGNTSVTQTQLNGNVGIGTTSPSYTLDVTGTGRFTSTLLVTGAATFSGTVAVTGTITGSSTIQGTRLISTVAIGTAPLTVTSTTAVTNLNADLLDGQDGSYYQSATNLNAGTVATARLGSGTANATSVLHGDQTWHAPVGIVPVGTVLSWLKSFTNTPALATEFVECNGQTLSDAGSVYNTQTIPDLNGFITPFTKRFLRGAAIVSGATVSGGVGDSSAHTHTVTSASTSISVAGTGTTFVTSVTSPTGSTTTLPPYYEVVWIIRIK